MLRLSPLPVRRLEQLVRLRVVLVFVDALAHVICFVVELALVLFGQMAVVLRHVFLLVALKPMFAALQAFGFPRRKLTALYAVCNALLLACLTPVDLVDAWMFGINLAGSAASVRATNNAVTVISARRISMGTASISWWLTSGATWPRKPRPSYIC